jgi:hypothetical protein
MIKNYFYRHKQQHTQIMENEFKATYSSREIYAGYFDKYTLEQLNKVPAGFSNNLIWNIAHIIVSQQLLAYGATGNTLLVSPEMVSAYRGGTRPERDVTQQEADEIKALLFATIEKTETDYRSGIFTAYTERKTALGFMLTTVEDAIVFNNYHEGIHLGMMMGLRKFL